MDSRKNKVKFNELQLLKKGNLSSQKWALGSIIKVYFDEDKQVRIVKIKAHLEFTKDPYPKFVFRLLICNRVYVFFCGLILSIYLYLHLK